ncbi:hypothetical protein NKH77_48555 [Streptomyces sp. M19]
MDKLILRYAYKDVAEVAGTARRMQQGKLDAIAAIFVNQNFGAVRELLNPDSLLCALGVADKRYVEALRP